MIDKEQFIECGKQLSAMKTGGPLRIKMNRILNLLGKVSHRDTLDEIIQICLQKEIDVQCLIEALNASEDEQKKSLQYFFAGYNSK